MTDRSILCSKYLVTAYVATTPAKTPKNVMVRLCRITIFTTAPRLAPSANQMPSRQVDGRLRAVCAENVDRPRRKTLILALHGGWRCTVVITNNSRDCPHIAFVLPDVNELRDSFTFACREFTKPMIPYLNSAEAFYGIYFKRCRNQFSAYFATDVLLDVLD
ncbi:MAG TPA: hypothetical protein VGN95_08665 [Pyrinomonadaceae bacterium]|jgi:hypothetical protein|nr:hypothetical protein [Pyrinomonadaceae bacterium]